MSEKSGGPELDARTRTYPGLNALRAIGAIMVVTTHTAFDTGRVISGWTGGILARFDFGVAIFFVLSGFLLSRPFLFAAAADRRHPSVPRYLWKRALRIMPLYWVTIGIVYVALADSNRVVTPTMWLRNLTLTQLYAKDLLPQGLTQMWSLATEAAFYVALPVMMFALLRKGFSERRIMIGLGVLSILGVVWQAWAVTVPGYQGHFAQWLPGYLPWFCAGIALATITVGDTLGRTSTPLVHRLAADPTGCWIVAALVFAISATPLCGPRDLTSQGSWPAAIKVVLYTISATLLVLPLVFGRADAGRVRQFCNSRTMFFLGEISYGIFCLHLIFLNSIIERPQYGLFRGHFAEVWCWTMLSTVIAATIAHYAVERPFLRLKGFGAGSGQGPSSGAGSPASVGPETDPSRSKPPAANARTSASPI